MLDIFPKNDIILLMSEKIALNGVLVESEGF